MFDDFEDESPTDPIETSPRPRVLVVEDDDALREMISNRLHRDAFEVLEAGSGFEALRVLGSPLAAELELIIMDVHMPGASGLEVAQWLRGGSCQVPILLITAFPTTEVCRRASLLDCAVLAKPFQFERLTNAGIAALVSSRFEPRTAS